MPAFLPTLDDSRSVTGPFFGDQLTQEECEILALQNIERRHFLGKEAPLFQTKWFDYRRLHPTKATLLYAHEYLLAYQLFHRIRLDLERSQYMKPVKGYTENIFEGKSRDYTAYWKGRQSADELGVPYDFYCKTIIRFAEETCWARCPRPSQMYSEKVREPVITAWAERLTYDLVLPNDPFYLAENYQGRPEQKGFQRYLLSVISKRREKRYVLCHVLYEARVLLEPLAIKFFGQDLVNTAKSLSKP